MSEAVYKDLLSKLLNCETQEEFDNVLATGRNLIDNYFHYLLQAEINAESDELRREALIGLEEGLLPQVCLNVTSYWITTPDKTYQQDSINALISYLVSPASVQAWDYFRKQDTTLQPGDIDRLESLVREKSIAAIFSFDSPAEMSEWVYYAAHFMPPSSTARSLLFNEISSANLAKGWAYSILGIFYSGEMDKTADLTDRIEYRKACNYLFRKALEIFTQSDHPFDWALAHLNLSFTLLKGNDFPQEQLLEAIRSSESALTVFRDGTETGDYWLAAKLNLGVAQAICGDDPANNVSMEKAIGLLKEVIKRIEELAESSDRRQWLITAKRSLGFAYYNKEDPRTNDDNVSAINGLEAAVDLINMHEQKELFLRDPEIFAALGILYSKVENEAPRVANLKKSIGYLNTYINLYPGNGAAEHLFESYLLLGNNYFELYRLREDVPFEALLHAYENALQLSPVEAAPVRWAAVKQSLSNVFSERADELRENNIEVAIGHLEDGIREFRKKKYENVFWPFIMMVNQAKLYLERIKGIRSENVKAALKLCDEAGQMLTWENHPEAWVLSHVNRIDAWLADIGDIDLNIERVIERLRLLLQQVTRDQASSLWAMLQGRLSSTYYRKAQRNSPADYDLAIEHGLNALQVYSPETSPLEYASIKGNLGTAYQKRFTGEREQNDIQAEECYKSALVIYRKEKHPFHWARMQLNLGVVNAEKVYGDVVANKEQALSYFNKANEAMLKDDDPLEWAGLQENLGTIYKNRHFGNNENNVQKSISFYENALSVYTPDLYPHECLRLIELNYGIFLYMQQRYPEALLVYITGHKALENIRSNIKPPGSRERLMDDKAAFYAVLVDCCIKCGDVEKAFEFMSASKGRSFAETLRASVSGMEAFLQQGPVFVRISRELDTIWDEIEHIQQSFRRTENNVFDINNWERYERLKALYGLRKEKKSFLAKNFPVAAATLNLAPASFEDALRIAGKLEVAIIEYYRHASGWVAFVIGNKKLNLVELSGEMDMVLEQVLSDLLLIRQGYPGEREVLFRQEMLNQMYSCIFEPLEEHLTGVSSLLISPYSILHQLPVGIARNPLGGAFMFDQYSIRVIANTSSINAILDQRMALPAYEEPTSTFVAAHSGSDGNLLKYAVTEAEVIRMEMPNTTLLYEEAAVVKYIIEQLNTSPFKVVHFSCHGSFNQDQPDLSGLHLNGTLTMEKIINEVRLKCSSLVVMSACQTGVSSISRSDDLAGLNQAWLIAGAGRVVSSLWAVNDESTMRLFKVFYEQLAKPGENEVSALRTAMKTLGKEDGYSSPFHWGAFQVYGID